MSRVDDGRPIVLVVDDTPDTLGFLTEALEQSGYTTLVATGGLQALALVERITPDLVLLDAMMPGLDGFETCRRLKKSAIGYVPVIFMTALSETEHIVAGLAAGGVDYVAKPIILDELFARIRVHLSNARAAQSAQTALDRSGSFLLAVDETGLILWSTPQALSLIEPALAPGPERRLTATLLTQLTAPTDEPAVNPVVVAQENGRAIRITPVSALRPGEWLLRVGEHDRRSDAAILAQRLSLTAREAEVLLWVARGKANRDIGEILRLSPRTVNKHLETIFTKLGIENRASAAVVATRALGERS